MKAKKNKVGRPKKKDKRVGYTFTIDKSIMNVLGQAGGKPYFDAIFRDTLTQSTKRFIPTNKMK